MKKGIKGLLAAIILVTTAGLMGCSATDTPEKAVKNRLESYIESKDDILDSLTYRKMYGSDDDPDEELSEEHRAVAEKLYEIYDYEIVSSQEKGKKGIVKVKITTMDTEKYVDDYEKAVFLYNHSLENLMKDDESSGADGKKLLSIGKELMEKNDYGKKTIEADLSVEKKGRWKVVENQTFKDALRGNYHVYARDTKRIPPKEFVDIYLNYIKSLTSDQIYEYYIRDNGEDFLLKAYIERLADDFDYKIKKETIDGDEAKVIVELTLPDLSELINELEKTAGKSADKYIDNSEDGFNEAGEKLIIDTIKNGKKTRKQNMEFAFETGETNWDPENLLDIWNVFIEAMQIGID